MKKTLDQKLKNIIENPSCSDFILADARDPDMAFGLAGPGRGYPELPDERYHTMEWFLEQIKEVLASGDLDILLASNSAMSVLAHREDIFASSSVTPAIRANDTTDVWISRVANYRDQPSRPFRTADLSEAQYGSSTAPRNEPPKVNLGLYSITFNNDLGADYDHLAAYKLFRVDAAKAGFDHFLEVFAPNVEDCGLNASEIPLFVNDCIIRSLAGVSRTHWPKFLKIPYFGPRAMEELAHYDAELVVGILGGGAGTTYDAFKQLTEAKKYGARVALYGRKIKEAEHPLTMVSMLRKLADGVITAEEAVKVYHDELQKLKLKPRRSLENDLTLTSPELHYAK